MSHPVKSTAACLGLCAAAALAGCQTQHPVALRYDAVPEHQHPQQDWWKHQFVYFPAQQIYFEPYTETYFWFDSGLWEEGMELPDSINPAPGSARVVRLQHEKPYVQHATVTTWHPGYWDALPGSTDPYHATPEAISLSEQRSAIRLARSVDELQEISRLMDLPTATQGFQQDMAGSGLTGSPLSSAGSDADDAQSSEQDQQIAQSEQNEAQTNEGASETMTAQGEQNQSDADQSEQEQIATGSNPDIEH